MSRAAEELAGVVSKLYSRRPEHQIRPRLAPTLRFTELMGRPQDNFRVIHLTGTNGKTTTTRMVEQILRTAGLRTGRLTSPHLVRINERIAIAGEPILDELLVETYRENEELLTWIDGELERAGEHKLTFFEAFTGLALQAFSTEAVDVAVVEVGMGGEWDSTNVVTADVAVFTTVDLDHQASLGNTVEEIANTKAGIIKPGSRVVIGPQLESVQRVLRDRAANHELVQFGIDFDLTSERSEGYQTEFSVKGRFGEYVNLRMPILGSHQAQNAATAIAAVESFFGPAASPADEVFREAFAAVTSPGRLQVLRTSPLELIDGAHNPAGARSLLAALNGPFVGKSFVGVVGMFADKAVAEFLATIAPRLESLVLTQVDYPRAMPATDLLQIAEQYNSAVHLAETPVEAMQLARRIAAKSGSGLLVTGSLFLMGAVLEAEEA